MIIIADEVLIEEAARYELRFTCESCAHFESTRGNCSLEYPNDMHRSRALSAGDAVIFCKAFELA